MSRRVVFLCYHGVGHINPCFPLARILEQQGHTTTIATVAHFNGYVTRAGFNHYALRSVPFGLGFEAWSNIQRKVRFHYWANLRDRFADRLYHERLRELTSLVTELKPDVIFIDATQASDFIALYPLMKQRSIIPAMLHAMFPTHVLPGRPPVNSVVVPGSRQEELTALAKMQRTLNYTDFKQRLLYFGMSDRQLINRRLRRNQLPRRYQLNLPTLFDFQVADVPAYILAPREFDYPKFDNPVDHHYVGFMQYNIPKPPDESWARIKSTISAKRETGSRLVYCSFGTIEAGNEDQIDAFLLQLANVVTRAGDMLLISLGVKRSTPDKLARENVWIFPSVFQAEMLSISDAFVTHGGLSSIKEAIEAVVPMLMIVVHNQFDPPGNAARVQFHGMGMVGDISGEEESLRQQLQSLLSDERFKNNIRELRKKNKLAVPHQFLELFNTMCTRF